jgi:hypothetical protein
VARGHEPNGLTIRELADEECRKVAPIVISQNKIFQMQDAEGGKEPGSGIWPSRVWPKETLGQHNLAEF